MNPAEGTINELFARMRAHGPLMRTVSLPRGRHRLHVMPTSGGYDHVRAGSSYLWNGQRRGSTPFTVLQHTLSGEGRLVFERREMRVREGETMLVVVPHEHVYAVPDGGHWEFFWISMYGQEALRVHRTVQDQAGPVLRLGARAVAGIARAVLRLMEGEGTTPGEASAIAYDAQMALFDDVLGSHGEDAAPAHRDALDAVKAHVRANIRGELTVDELARIAGFSRAHFTRIFAATEGVSPAEYVFSERMRRAARLLEMSDLAVKAIALDCGFEDPNYFAKAFRRTYEASPREFRTTGMYSRLSPRGGFDAARPPAGDGEEP